MKKRSEEHLPEAITPLETETTVQKGELNSDKFGREEWEAFLTALRFLVKNKEQNKDNVTLEIKKNPLTHRRSAIIYRNSDREPIFMTEDEIEITYLQNPEKTLDLIETDLERTRATNQVVEDIKKN
ncbi:MAG: hypothetical protein Q8R55_01620 [Candidatus Taylorbacteria bacterium]|nr:hypothetical protein [Candidatus Taylorbacteria bacterium]